MASSSGMFVDGTEVDDLSALLERFTILRVSKQNDENGDGSAGAAKRVQAFLYTEIDGAVVPITDEVSLFGAIASLVQAGLPLKFRTTPSYSDADCESTRGSAGASTSPFPAVKKKRTREDLVPMIDRDDEGTDDLSRPSSPDVEYPPTHAKSRRRLCTDSCNEMKSTEDSRPSTSDKKSSTAYVGMNISADGLIVSKPDVFEHLLRGDKVLARVKDADGVVTTREL